MASITSEDESSEDNLSCSSLKSNYSLSWDEPVTDKSSNDSVHLLNSKKCPNLVTNLFNRELYGRFAKNPKAKTERAFKNIHTKCIYSLSSLIKEAETFCHIFMGFTLCGQYFLSYTERSYDNPPNFNSSFLYDAAYEYELYIWKFLPGQKLKCVSKHKIFNHLKGDFVLDRIIFIQFPNDLQKIVCYGYDESHQTDLFYISIMTLPSPSSCIHCHGSWSSNEEFMHQGWCSKHGFMVHYMFPTTQPAPHFDPHISLGFPNHLVINTGHHIHILNICTLDPNQASNSLTSFIKDEQNETKSNPPVSTNFFNDTFSEVSESTSDNFGCGSVVDAILEDFSEYDLESSEGNKPFHELNISCEPLNVTGKSYHNTLVQNIFDPRIKRLQNISKDYVFSVPHASTQKPPEKNKIIDKNIAEKAYEFIEENEKYEKISLFRKKRLADKKYEFSEDNTENIVPFHILRRERRYLFRSQGRIRSPDFNSLFLSPRSPGWRSPMQSPNSRNGPFSPSGVRHIYCTSVRNSPHHSKSPISPKDAARKVNVYSPSLDSDCSDSDSRLVLRTPINFATSNFNVDSRFNQNGLLIVDAKVETPKWIKKVVRRYSNGDFENSSLLSGQSRDDYNNPIEIPLLVQSLTDQQFDIIPEGKVDATERQIIVTQRSIDCEQFVQRRAQVLCTEANLEFMHCEDYDIKIVYVCPLNGVILCQAVIKIGALKSMVPNSKVENYWAHFLFTWNITTDAFDVIDSEKVFSAKEQLAIPTVKFPKFNCNKVWVLSYDTSHASKSYLRDKNNCYEICLCRNSDSDIFFDESSDYFRSTRFWANVPIV